MKNYFHIVFTLLLVSTAAHASAGVAHHLDDNPEYQKNKAHCPSAESLEAMVRAHKSVIEARADFTLKLTELNGILTAFKFMRP